MALGTPILLATGSVANDDPCTTGSASPTASALLLVFVSYRRSSRAIAGVSSTFSIDGAWQQVLADEATGGTEPGLAVYRAFASSSPGTGTVSVDMSGAANVAVSLVEITGVDTDTPTRNAKTGDNAGEGTTESLTLDSALLSGSVAFGLMNSAREAGANTAAGGSFSELSELDTTGANAQVHHVMYGASNALAWSNLIAGQRIFAGFEVVAGESGPDETPPTLTSATISADGESLSLAFDESVTIGSGGSGGFALDASGGAVTATYDSGDESSTLVYALSRAIEYDETVTLDYTQPGDGIEDAAGNDLASFAGQAVTNGVALLLESFWTAEDFSVNDVPDEWHAEIDVTAFTVQEASGEKFLQLTGADGEQSILTYLALSPAETSEVWIRFFFDTTGETGGPDGAIIARGQQLTGRSTMDLYSLNLDSQYSLNRLNNGSNTMMGDPAIPSPLPGVDSIGQARLRVEGTSIKARFWADGDSEPETWDLETTDSSIEGRGRVGVYAYRGVKIRIYQFGVATGGGSAPTSAVPAEVTTAWIGAVTDDSITAMVEASSRSVMRLAVSESSDMSSPAYSTVSSKSARVKLTISGLDPATTYYWGVELDSTLSSTPLGSFKTFPAEGDPASFHFALGSCAGDTDEGLQGYPGRTPNISNAPTFVHIKDRAPLLFLHMGDFHYRDIEVNDASEYRQAYRDVLAELNQQRLYRSVPTVYMWDDHDFGANNSGASNPGRPAALTAYRDMVPHYGLPAGDPDDTPVYQTFVAGRVRFIILDARSERTTGTILGSTQLAWLLNLIETATEKFIVINVSMPWIATSVTDTWSDASTERATIAEAIETYQKGRVLLVHGDSHMVAIDDGTNSQYADSEDPGPPVFCAAPFDAGNSVKGGPYSEGTYADDMQQYGAVEITDAGTDKITVKLRGFKVEDDTETELVSYQFEVETGETGSEPVEVGQDQTTSATSSAYAASVSHEPLTASQDATASATASAYDASAASQQSIEAAQDQTASASTGAYAASVTTSPLEAAQGATARATTSAYSASAGTGVSVAAAQDATASATSTAYEASVTHEAKTASQDSTASALASAFAALVTTEPKAASQDGTAAATANAYNAIAGAAAKRATQGSTARATSSAYAGAVSIGPAVTAIQAQTASATASAYAAAVALGTPVIASQDATANATASAYAAGVTLVDTSEVITTLSVALRDAYALQLSLSDTNTLTLALGD